MINFNLSKSTLNVEPRTLEPTTIEIKNPMKPIYFPYTYVSNPVAEAVAACFGQFTVYQPLSDELPLTMQSWVDKGVIDIRIPVRSDNRELKSAAENYLNWANLYAGSSGTNRASLKTLKSSAPLLEASLSSQIVADVKKQINGTATAKSSDPVLSSRIFLYFAQEFDQQSQELGHVLMESNQKEQDLIHELKNEEDALAAELKKEPGHIPDVDSDYLILGRLEAWTRLLLRDGQAPGLFVTHSTTVLEHLLDSAPTAEKILDFEAIPRATDTGLAPWQEQLMSYLSDIVENKWSTLSGEKASGIDIPPTEHTVSLKIYLVPDQNFPQFFCRGAGIKDSESDPVRLTAGGRNTLLGLVEL